MNLDTEKLGIRTFIVKFNDGSKEVIKPVPWKDLDDVQILQYQILQATANAGGSPGDILNPKNKDFWNPAKKLAKLMPVVGSEEKGIDLNKIDDCETLLEIFVTTTSNRDPETGFITPPTDKSNLEPSLISRINGINFIRLLIQVAQESQKKSSS